MAPAAPAPAIASRPPAGAVVVRPPVVVAPPAGTHTPTTPAAQTPVVVLRLVAPPVKVVPPPVAVTPVAPAPVAAAPVVEEAPAAVEPTIEVPSVEAVVTPVVEAPAAPAVPVRRVVMPQTGPRVEGFIRLRRAPRLGFSVDGRSSSVRVRVGLREHRDRGHRRRWLRAHAGQCIRRGRFLRERRVDRVDLRVQGLRREREYGLWCAVRVVQLRLDRAKVADRNASRLRGQDNGAGANATRR